ncbi:predicted protein [Streptomyces viridosporus ATCC 14672]|uniref:Predicted protein n=1 Tax=Streptomyces viridosporus (strain ATCC 14672 / DSM 40746 / JCM 4963 / KCTC 9882 / NRRL B-12104 / FH 1290) TaxID=566461 RepID=D6AAJ1_STRV1|nr:predicted protein [Streptomyces viridosporus ATCC 14672]
MPELRTRLPANVIPFSSRTPRTRGMAPGGRGLLPRVLLAPVDRERLAADQAVHLGEATGRR